MADNKKKAINELKTGLEKFRDAALKKGWEQDEVDEKVKEVFESKSLEHLCIFCSDITMFLI